MRKWLAGRLGQCSVWLAAPARWLSAAADRVHPTFSKRHAYGGEASLRRQDDDSVPVILLQGCDGSEWEIRGGGQ